MRQVPYYLIIGNGRVARHFQHYFKHLALSHSTWHRRQPLAALQQAAAKATHILILIKDDAIDHFIDTHLSDVDAHILHFSGSLNSEKAYGAHPLMTFSNDLYDLSQYQSIPFVIDHDAPAEADLLPGLPNPTMRLHKSQKAKYHAWCVLSGNFSCLLWQHFFKSLEADFHIPPHAAHGYLYQQTQNLLTHPETALTGPLVRADRVTLKKNLEALKDDPFQKVYQSFMDCYAEIMSDMKHEHF